MFKRAMPMLALLLAGGLSSLPLSAQSAKKVLFDHTGWEDGGSSAYWIVDTHEPNPSPANPAVETDWNGGISAWGFDLLKKGYTVQILPATGGRITYNDSTNAQDLKNYAVYVIPECYRMFTAAEKQAIVAFVQNGGGLYLMGNHDGAARVTSAHPGSTDAFHVFNDLLANEGSGFGFTFVVGHGPGDSNANTTTTAVTADTGAIAQALVHGANGLVNTMDFHSYSYINLTGSNPAVKWIVQTQVSGDPATDYFAVATTYGAGRILAISDSAPSDDGTTTTSGKHLQDGYHSNSNQAFDLNAVDWLAGAGSSSGGSNTVTASITTPSSNLTIASGASQSFVGTSTDSSTSATLTYSWNFGDGSTATGVSTSHAFTNSGSSAVTRTVTFTAMDSTGVSASATRLVTVNPATGGGGGTTTQLLQNPGFESGNNNWSGTSGVIGQNNAKGEPAHGGTWNAWLDGYGASTTDTLGQTVTIPSSATKATLTFWLHVDTDETSTTKAYDKLSVQLLKTSGSVLKTLATYSNLNAGSGYTQKTFDLSAYKGQTIKLNLKGVEDSSYQTSFVVDDFALNIQ
ncbi:MAG: hypothetical protein JST24_00135 [Acidobacteria bacterium]|nr:hypothetical protein [Acidobacteriota bacterium]